MAKRSHCFLPLDDKCQFLPLDDTSKQRYKVKINIQGYDPYQIKKEKLSGNISKFPPVQ